MQRTVK